MTKNLNYEVIENHVKNRGTLYKGSPYIVVYFDTHYTEENSIPKFGKAPGIWNGQKFTYCEGMFVSLDVEPTMDAVKGILPSPHQIIGWRRVAEGVLSE